MDITVIAHPNSKKAFVKKEADNIYHTYITKRPVDGAANKAIIDSLAEYLSIKKNSILLLSGEKAKHKIFRVLIPH